MKKLLLFLIAFYQKHISPYKGGACCRFYPTCSEYAKEAVLKYGSIRGGVKAAKRVLRCNPLCRGGYDPLK